MIDKDLYLKTISKNLERVDSNNWDKSFIERCIKKHNSNVIHRNRQIEELRCFKGDREQILDCELDRDLSRTFVEYLGYYIKYDIWDKNSLAVDLQNLYIVYIERLDI